MQGHSPVPAATRKRRASGLTISLFLINTSGPLSVGTINYLMSLAKMRAREILHYVQGGHDAHCAC